MGVIGGACRDCHWNQIRTRLVKRRLCEGSMSSAVPILITTPQSSHMIKVGLEDHSNRNGSRFKRTSGPEPYTLKL